MSETPARRNDWQTLRALLPYLWQYKVRVITAMLLLVAAKVANVGVPLVLKRIVDALGVTPHTAVLLPLGLVLAYGALRLCASVFGELRDAVFAKVTQGAIRRVALQVFDHLHALSLRFHLERQTGGMTRDIDRGSKGIAFLLNFTLFNILPTLVEIVLVALILLKKYDWYFAAITFGTIVIYIAFTLGITEWRMVHRRTMNNMDSEASTRAVDSLLNYETVKYFGNERWESERYDKSLRKWESASVKNQVSLSFLNAGQAGIIALGVTALVGLAAQEVVTGKMTLGDLVLVNAFLLQLYAPLNFLGFIYREIKHSLADMEKMFALLNRNAEIKDNANAIPLQTQQAAVAFNNVDFGYEADRDILQGVSFEIPAGKTVAVVGSSGAGKSTLSRLLFRFYDVNAGQVSINGHDIRNLTQSSLRQHIGIVPQDTVLFNDTIYYNIAYGDPTASHEQVIEAARSAHIYDFIMSLPQGFETTVGERGLKLSGGEKQRVAIARTILKNPPILIFDEATSALDSRTEKAIQAELRAIAASRTTLVIAHRLSTIADADQILVMDHGRIVERGTHGDLLAAQGAYARLWQLQQHEQQTTPLEAAPE
ncbi:ABCB family ABC transporter ATP-binding protein/permease [Amantichitinum ursilacus]|uniref:Putative multidrug export ATP-binding/permease protein n=1 Tax=Amantichitinum ursilacus TaxID=857265 RepID=A0A0N0XIY2_9NEIS|nr:ABC transporter ATP-binding protein/permease [Amantichitinum ursilacus]KPC50541.1 putative multidrug export ATP-binding/permease protein [Amantichitinum ursilacus]